MDDLILDLKNLIVDLLDLEDVEPGDIGTDDALFGGGLDLDSIDALELGIGLQKKFGVRFDADSEENEALFRSVATLAEYISASR